MGNTSSSFSIASEDIASWVENVTGQRPEKAPAGMADQHAGLTLCPMKMTAPERQSHNASMCVSAMGWFALSIGPEAPDNGCEWFDALYFAAFTSPEIELSPEPISQGYWRTPAALNLALGRRIERISEQPGTGVVQHPLVFSVHAVPTGGTPDDLIKDDPLPDETEGQKGRRS